MKRIIWVSLFLFFALTGKAQNIDKTVVPIISITKPYGDYFLSNLMVQMVTAVELQTSGLGRIEADFESKYFDSTLFILDNSTNRCVYRFNDAGELLSVIFETPKSGKDSSILAYQNPLKFSIDPKNKQIDLYNYNESMIKSFNYNGKLISKTPLKIGPADFIRSSTGNFLIYSGWNNLDTPYKLTKISPSGSVLEQKMKLKSTCMPTEGKAFSNTTNGICMWELFGNYTYIIKNDVEKKSYQLDFGSRNLPLKYHQLDPEYAFDLITKYGYFYTKKYLENDQYAYFYLNYRDQKDVACLHVFYNKTLKKTNIYFENPSLVIFDEAVGITADNELVYLVSPRNLRRMFKSEKEYVNPQFEVLKEIADSAQSPLLVKVKIAEPE